MSRIAKRTSTEFDEDVEFLDGVPYFPPEVTYRSEMDEYFSTLVANHASAYVYPLSEDFSFAANIPARSSTEAPNVRSLPNFARHGGDFRFTLDIGIQQMDEDRTRNSYSSQVWVANVTTLEGGSTHPEEGKLESVVLKIVQPSLLPFPHPGREDPWSISPSARQLACSEDWFYRHKLSTFQGIQVPWYFGKFEVKMPNKEKAHALIMEHIEGTTLYDLADGYKETTDNDRTQHLQRLERIFSSVLETFRPLDSANVFLNHIPLDNVIIGEDDKVVVIGFANRCICENIEELKGRLKMVNRSATSQGESVVMSLLSVHLPASVDRASKSALQFMEWASEGSETCKAWYMRKQAGRRR